MGNDTDPDQNSTADEKGSSFNSNERKTEGSSDFVWSFRGYQLKSSEFTTAMVHFFRAEVQRANVWRQRLDTTTNWAVITTGAALSIAFSQSGNHVVIFFLNILLVTIFLLIEGRRYRYYELWSYRVRLMETDFFAPMLVPPFHPSPDWAEALSESLLHPTYPISTIEAIGRRLRRNYLYIYTIVGAAWLAKLSLLPLPVSTWGELGERAAIGPVSGMVVFTIAFIFCLIVAIFSIITIRLQGSPGEVLPRFGPDVDGKLMGERQGSRQRSAWFRPTHRRPQLLTLIITDQQELVAGKIMKDMGRGITSLSGKGMYTGDTHQILLCALTVTEVPQLKSLVVAIDPKAFVIVMPASEVLGYGFQPLDEKD